ncbi:MAG: alpha-galactosidase [Clostridia bacterium]|nr:alpha-galactosidase [Clostridia bacterium]
MIFDLKNFTAKIICDTEVSDASIETRIDGNELELYISALNDKPRFVELKWTFETGKEMFVLGDAWERSYGDLEFRSLSENDRQMPWYFIATDKETSFCFGVKTQPNSFVSFRYDTNGITALVDCRNGGNGVHLNGRKLCLATFVLSEYDNADILECLKDYLRKICIATILPKEKIYGANNWYYAYGKSSYEEIIDDARLQVEMSEGIENKPFQVIDDCWQINSCAGPWLPNEKFRDMKKLAAEIKEIGARPGIWMRPLRSHDDAITDEMKISRPDGKERYLDPTHPSSQAYIRADIERIKDWGYELIKHDFTTADLFGCFGGAADGTITREMDWNFYDKTKTNAEITLDLYRLIREAAGDMLIIGCNTISHLCAGLVEINRTGDDTSGREWERTPRMGVNTLAFRLAQNEIFYMCDADCVGIVPECPWEKNNQWLHLLSYSNTPLFASCNNSISEEIKEDIKTAYKVFNDAEPHAFRPIDFYETKTPVQWEIDGEKVTYNWE